MKAVILANAFQARDYTQMAGHAWTITDVLLITEDVSMYAVSHRDESAARATQDID